MDANLVPGGDVKDAVDALHGREQGLALCDVAGMHLDAECLEHAGLLGRANQRHDLVAAADELLDDFPANEARRARDEVFRHCPATAYYACN